MKAIIYKNYGAPKVLQLEEVATPTPKEKELLVQVKAASVNRTDCGMLSGKPYVFRLFIGGLRRPTRQILGTSFAGVVAAVGKGVTTYQVGDKVFGFHDEGLSSFAEYMTIQANGPLAKMPENISFEQAAASPEGTHYAQNFINKVKLESGQRVLVNGATGAIGSAAIQLLKNKGVQVTAVANTKNMDLIRSLGITDVIDYQKEDFTKRGGQYHIIADAVGKSSFGKCKPLLRKGGIYISSELGWMAQNLYLPLFTRLIGNKRVIFPIPFDCKKSVLLLKDWMGQGIFTPVIDRVYPFDQVAEAFTYVQTGEKTGNVVLSID